MQCTFIRTNLNANKVQTRVVEDN